MGKTKSADEIFAEEFGEDAVAPMVTKGQAAPKQKAVSQPKAKGGSKSADEIFAEEFPEEVAPQPVAPPAPKNMLQGGIEYTRQFPIAQAARIPEALEMTGQFLGNVVAAPGEIAKNPMQAGLGALAGAGSAGLNLVDTASNLYNQATNLKTGTPLDYLMPGTYLPPKPPTPIVNTQARYNQVPQIKAAMEGAPNMAALGQAIPYMAPGLRAVGMAGPGAGLAARMGAGFAGQGALGAGMNLNSQIQQGQPMNPLVAAQNALPMAYMGAAFGLMPHAQPEQPPSYQGVIVPGGGRGNFAPQGPGMRAAQAARLRAAARQQREAPAVAQPPTKNATVSQELLPERNPNQGVIVPGGRSGFYESPATRAVRANRLRQPEKQARQQKEQQAAAQDYQSWQEWHNLKAKQEQAGRPAKEAHEASVRKLQGEAKTEASWLENEREVGNSPRENVRKLQAAADRSGAPYRYKETSTGHILRTEKDIQVTKAGTTIEHGGFRKPKIVDNVQRELADLGGEAPPWKPQPKPEKPATKPEPKPVNKVSQSWFDDERPTERPAPAEPVPEGAITIRKIREQEKVEGEPYFEKEPRVNIYTLRDAEGQELARWSYKSLAEQDKAIPEGVQDKYNAALEKSREPKPASQFEMTPERQKAIDAALTNADKDVMRSEGIVQDFKEGVKPFTKTSTNRRGEPATPEQKARAAESHLLQNKAHKQDLEVLKKAAQPGGLTKENAVAVHNAAMDVIEHYDKLIPTAKSRKTMFEGAKEFALGILEHTEQFFKEYVGQEKGSGRADLGLYLTGVIPAIKLAQATSRGTLGLARAVARSVDDTARRFGQKTAAYAALNKITTQEGKKTLFHFLKANAGVLLDGDIIKQMDPALAADMRIAMGKMESRMKGAPSLDSIAEREAMAKSFSMSVEEMEKGKGLEALSEKQKDFAIGIKRITTEFADGIRNSWKEAPEGPYRDFLSRFYEAQTGRTIGRGDTVQLPEGVIQAADVRNMMYANIVMGNWKIHNIHFLDALIHGTTYLGPRAFFSGAAKAYKSPVVKAFVGDFASSKGFIRSLREDELGALEKHVGKRIENTVSKIPGSKQLKEVGKKLEGGWLEDEKMKVLRAGILERTAKDMGLKNAEDLVNRINSKTLSPQAELEAYSRMAEGLSDMMGYNPVGIKNRQVLERRLGSLGKIVQVFSGMRTIQSRLLWKAYETAATTGDYGPALRMHTLLAMTGGATTLTRAGKLALALSIGDAGLNEVEKMLNHLNILPIKAEHLTPDLIPAIYYNFDGLSDLRDQLAAIASDPAGQFKSLDAFKKNGSMVVTTALGATATGLPSARNLAELASNLKAGAAGGKEVAVYDDYPLLDKPHGKTVIPMDAWTALFDFFSPRDIKSVAAAKEAQIHRGRVLSSIGSRYGPKAREEARSWLAEKIDGPDGKPLTVYLPDEKIDWVKFQQDADSYFDTKEWKEYETSEKETGEATKIDKAVARQEYQEESEKADERAKEVFSPEETNPLETLNLVNE